MTPTTGADLLASIRRREPNLNLNNRTRTRYYLDFWIENPEIPWSLLAHLVSRNAGYQMTDIRRYLRWLTTLTRVAEPPLVETEAVAASIFFRFLEVGNFLIFRDIFPQLEAYRATKAAPGSPDIFFDTVASAAERDIDPFPIERWKEFFAAARAANFFPQWWLSPEVERMSFSLISNEQNQIEDRLVHDPSGRYLGSWSEKITEFFIQTVNRMGWTRLGFPLATSTANAKANEIVIYEVPDFGALDSRIDIGRDLFVGLFAEKPTQRERLIAWTMAHQTHSGSRADYNPDSYTMDSWLGVVSDPVSAKYSPVVVPIPGHDDSWPEDAANLPGGKVLHQLPVKLPKKVTDRLEANGTPKWLRWVSPLAESVRPLVVHDVAELGEIKW